MKAILVFIDGTTCDMRHRIPVQGMAEFFSDENIMKDIPTVGSVECMSELAQNYHLVYIGARPRENWYISTADYKITVNAYSYTIITAHRLKNK